MVVGLKMGKEISFSKKLKTALDYKMEIRWKYFPGKLYRVSNPVMVKNTAGKRKSS